MSQVPAPHIQSEVHPEGIKQAVIHSQLPNKVPLIQNCDVWDACPMHIDESRIAWPARVIFLRTVETIKRPLLQRKLQVQRMIAHHSKKHYASTPLGCRPYQARPSQCMESLTQYSTPAPWTSAGSAAAPPVRMRARVMSELQCQKVAAFSNMMSFNTPV
eukprot:358478-Chlamydomonas_euryale.AAC.4